MRFLNLLFLILVSLPVFSQTGYIEGNPKLAYWKVGNRTEVIIALHGGPCVEHSYLRPEFDGLRKTARIIYYDQRGCGKSELAETYLWQDHIRDIKRVIQTLAPEEKVFLVGSSWGSILALLYAYHNPEDIKGLILSGLINWEGKANDDEKYASFLKNNPWENSQQPLERILKENRLIERISKEGKIFEELVSIEKGITWYFGKMSQQARVSLATAPVFDSLTRIKVPILIFNGSKPCSYWESVNKYAELLPNSMIVSINGACHDPWFSNPQLFRKESNKFIRKHKKIK